MSYSKLFALCAGCAIAATSAGAAPDYVGQQSAYNDLLVTPAPYPGNTVDSPARAENGRLWVGREINEYQTVHAPGVAAYGASPREQDKLIYVRVNQTAVAISPWDRISDGGLQDLERARNLWLKENGYVLGVRTFVNPRFAQDDSAHASAASAPIHRATIRRHVTPKNPGKIQVMNPVSSQPIARISKPGEIVHAPATEIARADETTSD